MGWRGFREVAEVLLGLGFLSQAGGQWVGHLGMERFLSVPR